jgi:hypothetical protein
MTHLRSITTSGPRAILVAAVGITTVLLAGPADPAHEVLQ